MITGQSGQHRSGCNENGANTWIRRVQNLNELAF